ncbi:MAG: GNAT family N-acetyltransferase [Rubellimicrobium sp.]|nr:GNAT family N-acetyltransferase [Rubellimicrobium sp.]
MKIDQITTQAEIRGERIVLRPLRPADAGAIARQAGDLRVAQGTKSIPHPYPPASADALIASAAAPDRTRDVWAIDGSAQGWGDVVGLVTLTRLDRGQSEVSYWVAPDHWNTGIASEALRALIAANPHGAATYFAEAFQDNPGSARVLTNCGFDYLGDAEAHSVARGTTAPTWTYALKVGR